MRANSSVTVMVAGLVVTALATASAQTSAPKPVEAAVRAVHEAALRALPFSDRQDFDDARRGFIATVPEAGRSGRYAFLDAESAPDTVHPSLWRLARLNAIHGLFEIVPGVYQVRGFALANMTFIEGATGVIVVDPLGSVGAAKAALDLYFAHRPRRPVTAVIYTHSHSDHYGGARGVVDPAEVAAGRVVVVAPAGFMDAVVAESVVAGNAMSRRAAYQFGAPLPRGPRGIGRCRARQGRWRRRARALGHRAHRSIAEPIETRTIDGVAIVFQLTPNTEAPAELHIFLPKQRVLNLAENATHTMHNLLPFRGAKVRDASGVVGYI